MINTLIKSGKINQEAHKLAKKLIKPGEDINQIGKQIDDFVIKNKAQPAWPVNLSINNEAAHNSYDLETKRIIQKDDVIKVDIGVSIDGYITDAAQTIVFNKENEKLRDSAFNSLKAAKEYLQKNYKTATIGEIGEIIENEIKKSDFKPIVNLTGHYLDKYKAHDSPSIPNIKTNNNTKFYDIKNKVFAIEPFVTKGTGFVYEGDKIFIFEHIKDKPIRNKDAKKLLEEIKQFNSLPFSEFWIGKDLSSFSRKFAIRELLKNEIISAYPVLVDKDKVSQFETTFFIDEKKGLIDLVKIDEI